MLRAGAGALAARAAGAGGQGARAQAGGFAPKVADWVETDRVGLSLFQADGAPDVGEVSFAADFPFFAVAPRWAGPAGPGASVVARFSLDGSVWSNPYTIGEDPDSGLADPDGRRFGQLCGVPGGAAHVRYQTYDASGAPARLPGFAWATIDASAGPGAAAFAQLADDSGGGFGPPPIVSRAAWGCDESLRFAKNGNEIWPETWATVEHVVVHHSDTMNFEDPGEAIRSIYAYHAVTKGWGDIGYNYVVDFLGNVYEGRYGGENVVGGHAFGYNVGTCGVCLMGRYGEAQITPEMRDGLRWIAAWAARGLDPAGSADFEDIPNLPTIVAHRDVNPTTCPGDDLYGDLGQVRQDAAAILAGTLPPNLPTPEFANGQRVVTAVDGGKLREGPGTEFAVITPVPAGENLTVSEGPTTNDGDAWYAVRGSSLAGWIVADVLAPSTAVGGESGGDAEDQAHGGGKGANGGGKGGKRRKQEAAPGTAGLAQPAALAPGSGAVVADGPLNLRTGPSRDAGIVSVLAVGQPVTLISGPETGGGEAWYLVRAADGATGWCSGTYLGGLAAGG